MRISTAKDRPEADSPVEVVLEATSDELSALYQALAQMQAQLPASDSHTESGDLTLAGIEVTRVPDALLRISVDPERRVLSIVGGERQTRSFAVNVLDIAQEMPVGHSQRFIWFRDHFYLDPQTVTLVVRLAAASPSPA